MVPYAVNAHSFAFIVEMPPNIHLGVETDLPQHARITSAVVCRIGVICEPSAYYWRKFAPRIQLYRTAYSVIGVYAIAVYIFRRQLVGVRLPQIRIGNKEILIRSRI